MRLILDLLRHGEVVRYGALTDQVGEVRRPRGRGPHPVAVVLHGGYWGERWTRRYMRPLCADLARRGFVSLNLEYRRLGTRSGGGWPQTFEDVAAGVDLVAGLGDDVDPGRVAFVGHSAGGHLALWAAIRHQLPEGAPGAGPAIRPAVVVGLAAVSRVPAWAGALLGGPREAVPQRWRIATPAEHVPIGVPVLLLHGRADQVVPATASERFARAASEAGDDVELLELAGSRHTAFAYPRSSAWRCAAERLERWAAGGALLERPGDPSPGREAATPAA